MTTATAPGVRPYSKDWMEACATEVEEPLMRAVLRICEEQMLDSRGPNEVARAITEELRGVFVSKHTLRSGAQVVPWQLWLDAHGWHYRGDILGADPPEEEIVYQASDIERSEEWDGRPEP